MKIYFVTYGNKKFKYSVKRIKKEAQKLNIFSAILDFSEKDLPISITSSPLFLNGKGGGYWLWKPYIIQKVMKKIRKGDVIFYIDSGSQIYKSSKWTEYFNKLKDYDSIFFQYKENFNYGWSKNTNYVDSPKIKYWIKKSAVNHFKHMFDNDADWLEKSKLCAGVSFIKKTDNNIELVDEWLNHMLLFPEIVVDPLESEKSHQIDGFGEHRHDQSIISVLVRYFHKKNNILILDEDFETNHKNQIARTIRKIDLSYYGRFKNLIKNSLRRLQLK
jgi:hypothetical protein